MISVSSRRLARQADEAATAAVLGATSFRGDAHRQSAAFDAAIHADDAAVLALSAVDGTEQSALEVHVRAALAYAEAALRLTTPAAC